MPISASSTTSLGRTRALLCGWLLLPCLASAHDPGSADFSDLSLDELSQVQISSVSRRPEPLQNASAAVYVISREDIRRSGATSIPEALRLAPNLQVARINSATYAISARGFNNASANKLLVLVDGRIVYSPLHSGVFWEAQDVFLPDVERIEVISGPGGTLWGSNAFNGVINVITRSARETQGTLATAAAGTEQQLLNFRHGASFNENGQFRVYARSAQHEQTHNSAGLPSDDAFQKSQAGFRSDWSAGPSSWTLQGDVYDGSIDQPGASDRKLSGSNLLARWAQTLTGGGSVQAEAYYDGSKQISRPLFEETVHTLDLELQHHFITGNGHQIVWGGGYRSMEDEVINGATFAFFPASRSLRWANLFVQDSFAVSARTQLTLGLKLEHNSYTGLEVQPNLRVAYKPDEQRLIWSAVSRAVRTPSRLDRDTFFPSSAPFLLAGGPDFQSEELVSYELGYRQQFSPGTSFSMSTFYNDYSKLRSLEPHPVTVFPYVIANNMAGHAYGIETWAAHQLNERWRFTVGYNLLHVRLHFVPPSGDTNLSNAGNDPHHQFFFRAAARLAQNLELDANLRSVGRLHHPEVPAYTELDMRLGWAVHQHVDLSLIAANLLDRRHAEFTASATSAPVELGRSFLLRLTWNH